MEKPLMLSLFTGGLVSVTTSHAVEHLDNLYRAFRDRSHIPIHLALEPPVITR